MPMTTQQPGTIPSRHGLRAGVMLALASLLTSPDLFAADRQDLVLRGGRVIDGTGQPSYQADAAIRDGRIVAIGLMVEGGSSAGRGVDVSGLYICPGFIDMMGQTGAGFLRAPRSGDNLLLQGVTTINAGEGQSDAP